MDPLKTAVYLGICLATWTTAAAAYRAENVRWVSLDFKTLLTWEATPPHSYTVMYSWQEDEWQMTPNCAAIMESECDLSNHLIPPDRLYSADIQTESYDGSDYDFDDLPHAYAPDFNPYKQSEISAVSFTLETAGGGGGVTTLNISDPLTPIHRHGRQLNIRDIFLNDLKYKISYYKAGSTGKRDVVMDSNVAEMSMLDAGERYCFMVAAYIPSRDKALQLGAWSEQQCMSGHGDGLHDLSYGALIGGAFLLTLLVVIVVAVTVLCCRRRRQQRNRSLQQSAPV